MDNSLQIVNTNCEMQEWADKIAVATFLYVLGAEKTMFLYLLFTIGNRRFLTEFQAENLGLSRFLFQPDSMERTFGNQQFCQFISQWWKSRFFGRSVVRMKPSEEQ